MIEPREFFHKFSNKINKMTIRVKIFHCKIRLPINYLQMKLQAQKLAIVKEVRMKLQKEMTLLKRNAIYHQIV